MKDNYLVILLITIVILMGVSIYKVKERTTKFYENKILILQEEQKEYIQTAWRSGYELGKLNCK